MLLIGRLLRLKFDHLLRTSGVLATALVALLAAPQVAAQGSPFNCDVVFYQVKNTATVSQIVKFTNVNATSTPTGVYGATQTPIMNSLGYNPVDNYMYGLSAAGGVGASFYRIGTGGYQLVGAITNSLPGGTALAAGFVPTAGVFDAAGRYYFAGQGAGIVPAAIFRVDTIPATGALQVAHQYNLSPAAVANFGDFDFNGAGSPAGLLLGATTTNTYRITLTPNLTNPALGTASVVTVLHGAGPNGNDVGAVGSAFYDAFASKFYVFDNNNSDFWEIQNPQTGTPTPIFTDAVRYSGGPGAFAGVTGATPTDGTSCPLSGTRVADVAITKSDGITSIQQNAITSYNLVVTNAGPYPANYSVVRDAAAAGLTKLSVSCAAPVGPPTAVCPATLSVSTLEAGVQVITFPPGTTLVFTVNAQVTQTPGNFVTNTATVTPAADTTDNTPSNNISVDVDSVTAATSIVTSTPSFCPAGTVEVLTNLLTNGDFSSAAPLLSEAINSGNQNTYTVANSVNRQTGTAAYFPTSGILQNPFPGDAARSVSGTPNWLLSNGKNGAANYRVWNQAITGLNPARTYQFMAYVSNATRPGTASPTIPSFSMQRFNGAATATIATFSPVNEPVNDLWTLVQGTFTGVTNGTVSLVNTAAASAEPGGGDVSGLAQLTLRLCNPSPDVAVTKTNGTGTLISTSTTSYTITVVNLTAGVNATDTLIVDPAVSNLAKSTITCVATAGSSCPAALSIVGFETTGLTIPLITGTGTVTFRVGATVTGPPGNTATNIVTVSSTSYTDPNTANNQAQDADPIFGTASLSISKDNGVTSRVAGSTTSYTVTVSLTAGSQVVGAIFKDPAAAGLSCTSVTCVAAIGGTSCPSAGSTTIAALQGSGIVLPSMQAPSSLVFSVFCGITATGL